VTQITKRAELSRSAAEKDIDDEAESDHSRP